MKKPTKAQIEAAIKEIETVVICPTCGCKNNFHYAECDPYGFKKNKNK